ncbi:MAG: hypothetical protein KGY61_10425 [Desulfobacterales bacterium]|nr:hypothetical protein [Desulfobacterales bacterium]
MNADKEPLSTPVGIYKKSELEQTDATFRDSAVRQVLATREGRRLMGALIPEVLNVWAQGSRFKTGISRMVGNNLQQGVARSDILLQAKELPRLFEDPDFVERIADSLPAVINGLTRSLANALEAIDALSVQEKKKILEDLIPGIASGGSGKMLTRAASVLNDIHHSDPEFFARLLAPGFSNWVESTDFGEIREALENSGPDVRAVVQMANRIIWQYPSKVVSLLSMLPLVLNLVVESLDISIEKLNALSPDLLSDVICMLGKEIDGPSASRLVNGLSEIIRKIHTGSALLGDADNPQLYKILFEKFDEIIEGIDPTVVWKARVMILELKDQTDRAFFDAAAGNDAFMRLAFAKKPAIPNIRRRSLNRRLAFLEAMDDQTVSASLAEFLGEYDVQGAAEAFNRLLTLLNRLYENRPEVGGSVIRQFIDAMDLDELADAVRHILEDSGGELNPAARAVVPGLVAWVCEILKPADDAFEDDAARAREALANLFTTVEA